MNWLILAHHPSLPEGVCTVLLAAYDERVLRTVLGLLSSTNGTTFQLANARDVVIFADGQLARPRRPDVELAEA